MKVDYEKKDISKSPEVKKVKYEGDDNLQTRSLVRPKSQRNLKNEVSNRRRGR